MDCLLRIFREDAAGSTWAVWILWFRQTLDLLADTNTTWVRNSLLDAAFYSANMLLFFAYCMSPVALLRSRTAHVGVGRQALRIASTVYQNL